MRLSTKVWTSVNTKSLFVGVIIAAAVVAFAITGFGGSIGRNFNSNVAAHVGSQEVSLRQLNEVVQEYNRQGGNDPALQKANLQNALNQLVQSKVLLEEASRMGWKASDVEVAHWIRSLPAFQDEKTKKFRPDLYQRFLKSGRMTELELYQAGREAIAQSKMQALMSLAVPVPRKLLEDTALRDSTEFALEYLELKPASEALKAAQSAEAKAYAADKNNEKRLQDTWNTSKEEFEHKAQVRASGILIAWKEAQRAQGDALKRTKEEAHALAKGIAAKLKAGEKLSKLATETNDDTAAKSKGGDLGWLDETRIDPETWKAVATLTKEKPVSDVVETPFGFRLLQWTDARPEVKKSFEEVKEELASRIVSGQVQEKLMGSILAEASKALAEKKPELLQTLASKNGLSWTKLPKPITPKERFIEGIGASETLLPKLFELKNPGDTISQVMPISGRQFIFRLVSRKPGVPPTEDKIKEARATEEMLFARNFQEQTQRKLYDVYTREKDIRINPGLAGLD